MANFVKTIKGKQLIFNEMNHAYYLNQEPILSVTQLLQEQKITPDFEALPISQDKLKLCSEHGTIVHAEIEQIVELKGLNNGMTEDADFFKNNIYPLCDEWKSEIPLFTKDYAGRCDLLGKRSDGSYMLIDTKTGKVDKYAVAWQLSLYHKGLLYTGVLKATDKVEYYCFDAKGKDSGLIDIAKISDKEINRLLRCHRQGKTYEEPCLKLTQSQERAIAQLEAKIQFGEEAKKTYEAYKNSLKDALVAHGVTSYKGKRFNISYCEYQQTRFDSKRFKEDKPELYKEYCTQVVNCSKVTVTPVKEVIA